jgi:uncharacterized spore protein YtfJ
MTVQEILEQARESGSARIVYAQPYEQDGLTVIPAAAVVGGGGGGVDGETKYGGGLGLAARPVGAWVVDGRHVHWVPALDVNRLLVGAQLLALAALLVVRSVARARARIRR